MKNKIITYASILALSSIGHAKAPDLGANYTVISNDQIESRITIEDLTGASVVDKYNVEIAKVHDLEIDPNSGEVSTVYLAMGGVLGIGSSYASLPYSELKYNKAKGQFSVETTQSAIKAYVTHQEQASAKHNNALHMEHASESRASAMWAKVKSSLGVDEDELADVEADVRGNKLVLEGEVNDPALKRKIGDAFESSTELKVVNKIKVVQ